MLVLGFDLLVMKSWRLELVEVKVLAACLSVWMEQWKHLKHQVMVKIEGLAM